MQLLQKFSEKIGLTQTELKVIFFLVAIFMIGLIVKSLNWKNNTLPKNSFDYSASDSIFYSDNIPESKTAENKSFDSNQESSDFNKSDFKVNIRKQKLTEKSININIASLNQLTLLPGIGIKTAENILTYRRANGGFKNINELVEVKGISDLKLSKIKKYIFVR